MLRQLWTGAARPLAAEHYPLGTADGFIVPEPWPPIIVGAFGPKMAAVAGEAGDGINTPASGPGLATLLQIARDAHAATGRDPNAYLVTLSANMSPQWLERTRLGELEALGAHRLVLLVHPPFDLDAIRVAGAQLFASRPV